MRRILATASALAAALVAAATLTAAPAQASGVRPVVLHEGHADLIGIAFEDGELDLHIHDEESDTEYQPEQVTVRVAPQAQTTVPADPAFAFLGDPGVPVWILPQTENPDLLFAGMSTEEVEPGDLVGDRVRVSLAVFGPGEVALYIEDELGLPSEILFDTGDGLLNSFTLPAGGHTHANWAFSQPGNYYWAVTVTARVAGSHTFVTSGVSLYHFQVQG